jgi:hypothetical protein
MPNWCHNELFINNTEGNVDAALFWQLAGPTQPVDTLAQEIIEALKDQKPSEPLTFETLLPTPPELIENNNEGWYDWRVTNWGTKWDASDVEIVNDTTSIHIRFETAWAPPVPWIQTLGEHLPENYIVELVYVEQGNGYAGCTTYEEGHVYDREAEQGHEREFLADWGLEELWWEDEDNEEES